MSTTTFTFNGINNLIDAQSHPILRGGVVNQAVDIVNFTIVPPGGLHVRTGYTEVLAEDGVVYSDGFSNGTLSYVVADGVLCLFANGTLTPQTTMVGDVETEIAISGPISSCMVNDTLAFSDGTIFGLIEPTGTIAIVTNDTAWTDALEETQWADAGNSNTWYEAHDPGAMGGVKILDGGSF